MVIAEPGGHRDLAYLLELIEAQGVTDVHFVPSMLAVFIESLEARRGGCPRYGASGPAARRCRRPPSPLYTDCCPTSCWSASTDPPRPRSTRATVWSNPTMWLCRWVFQVPVSR